MFYKLNDSVHVVVMSEGFDNETYSNISRCRPIKDEIGG